MTNTRIEMGAGYNKVEICKTDKIYIRAIYQGDEFLFTRTTIYDKDGYVDKMFDTYSDGTVTN